VKARGRRRRPRRRAPAPAADGRTWAPTAVAAPLTVAALTLLAFAPVVQNGFVDWDDTDNLTANPFFRGLGWPELRWMWTTALMGHYIPLTWMSFGLDYLVWGLNPLGYHLTNLLLHVANACLVYAIATRLIGSSAAGDARADGVGVRLGATFAALLFSVHPLRVESVAWATERRDVLCGLFVLAAVLAYLRRTERAEAAHDRRWYWASLGLFAAAALSKSMAVTLPAVLLVLDVYPLQRLGGDPRTWLRPPASRVWVEKLPFLAVSAVVTVVAFVAVGGNLTAPIELGVVERVALSAYQVAFYLWKSIVPLGLAALYELPVPLMVWSRPFVVGALLLVAISTLAIVKRRRWPGVLAAWVGSAILLFPVSGIFHNGPQIAADRYTYLPALPWAVLAGVGLRLVWDTLSRLRPARALALGGAAAVVAALGALTWAQAQTWRDSGRLWTHALAVAPSSLAHYNLGVHLDGQGRWDEAIAHYRRALELKPDFAEAHYNWGVNLARQGRWADAIARYEHALRLKPDHAEAHVNWGVALAREGHWDAAIAHYARALELKPAFAAAHNNWGSALARQGRWREAAAHYREAVRIKPDLAEAHNNLGSVLAQQELWDEAIAHYRQALAIRPDFHEARENLARLLRAR
jgi:tetratricopeptide (TPR) repeat protein